ncbi:putative non-ribosomal peptide synthetase (plasmid) [Rhodococcus opacus B4]|uniref:Putative non-ribosomal peptide synthetase n=1 Tax=Rhodococcus opacus (strain B4) TaxID=632772 RepID=C1BCR3_RHOOB|nr:MULTISPECIES: AMP-binding protein [Rhodococcus]BAH55657.1 putative non-ribosomal peptide synthetase [Rhodococcus opacus B4]
MIDYPTHSNGLRSTPRNCAVISDPDPYTTSNAHTPSAATTPPTSSTPPVPPAPRRWCVVTHAGLANLAQEIREKYGISTASRLLHLASPTFDTALVEILAAANAGATLVVAPATAFGGRELAKFLWEHHITHLLATPSSLATVDPAGLDELQLVLVGGEPCPPPLVRRWAQGRDMRNAYGLPPKPRAVSP